MRAQATICVLVAVVLGLTVGGGAADPAKRGATVTSFERFLREPVGPAFSVNGRWPIDLIHLPAAWDITTGAQSGPLIAVIDTGVHITPDLTGRVDFESLVGGAAGSDSSGHGTRVAGIIAGSGSDGSGLAGVCWSCRILSIQVSSGITVAPDTIATAVDRATNRGAAVINLSLGSDQHTNAEREAIGRAVAAGIVVVASAGNDGSRVPVFPAAYAGVLSVGAAGRDGRAAAFSSNGPWVGVLAPSCGAALDAHDRPDDAFCGTSASAAFVSGVAGLLRSVAPIAKGPDVVAAIQRSAHPAAGSAHGIVDAAAALRTIGRITPGSTTQVKAPLLRLVRRPMISGVGAVGARLTTSTGAWSSAISKISVRWERCTSAGRKCRTVSWSSAYLVPASARGAALRVVVHATGEDDITVQAMSHLFPIRR